MILVTGATGQLGYDVVNELNKRNIPCLGISSKELNLELTEEIPLFLKKINPTALIHCGAYTAVDKAEEEPTLCETINATATKALAQSCQALAIKMLYISTDYVFSGEGTHFHEVEEETTPLGVYGQTKLQGEKFVQEYLDAYFIVRISWVFGKNGRNFVKTMKKLGQEKESLSVVSDQIGSPTYTVDLAVLLCDMMETEQYGIYHATNEGTCSWAEFATEIMTQTHATCEITEILSKDYPTKGKRPKNSRLSKGKLVEQGFQSLPHWKDALTRYLQEEST